MRRYAWTPIVGRTDLRLAQRPRPRLAAWPAAAAVIAVALLLLAPASGAFAAEPDVYLAPGAAMSGLMQANGPGIASTPVANEPYTLFQGLAGNPASATSVVVVQPYNAELSSAQIAALHAANPKAKIIRYVDAIEMIDTVADLTDPRAWSLDYAHRLNTDDEWSDVWAGHQSWFLKDSGGQYIHRPSTNNFEMNPKRAYLMDPANASWREWLVAKVAARLSYGYDGVFLDGCTPTPAGYTAIPAKYSGNYGAWRSGVNGLVDRIKAAHPSALVVINSIWQGQSYYANASPNPIDANKADGVEIEGFINAVGNGPTESEANWLKEVRVVGKLNGEGKIVLAHTALSSAGSASPKKLLAYSLATLLLARSTDKAYFSYFCYKAETGFNDAYMDYVYGLPLGAPSGAYYQKGAAYRRDFTNGEVIVNPNDSAQTYTFTPVAPNRYQDQDGHIYDSTHPLTLAAKTGAILVLSPAKSTRYEQTDSHIVKTGTWTTFVKSAASGGSYGRSSTAGASATITFVGTKLNLITMKGTTTGVASIYLDGVLKATIDTGAATASYKVPLWGSGDLPDGTHTVKIVRSNSSAAGKFLTLDAMDIWGTIGAP